LAFDLLIFLRIIGRDPGKEASVRREWKMADLLKRCPSCGNTNPWYVRPFLLNQEIYKKRR